MQNHQSAAWRYQQYIYKYIQTLNFIQQLSLTTSLYTCSKHWSRTITNLKISNHTRTWWHGQWNYVNAVNGEIGMKLTMLIAYQSWWHGLTHTQGWKTYIKDWFFKQGWKHGMNKKNRLCFFIFRLDKNRTDPCQASDTHMFVVGVKVTLFLIWQQWCHTCMMKNIQIYNQNIKTMLITNPSNSETSEKNQYTVLLKEKPCIIENMTHLCNEIYFLYVF